MPGKRTKLQGYGFPDATETLFFDANVWIGVFGEAGGDDISTQYQPYGAAIDVIQKKSRVVVVDPTVIGEFINRWFRQARRQYLGDDVPLDQLDAKSFRDMDEGKECLASAMDKVDEILSWTEVWPGGWHREDYEQAMARFRGGGIDYNDALFERLCLREDYTLVTHDSDFKDSEANILSANTNLTTDVWDSTRRAHQRAQQQARRIPRKRGR